ncbi:MAG TPA: hypothetical protein VLG47_06395 [Candidatus Saccharimonadales bacterium]|nr:hypothetical protein [Candidatus Saccharimonadales bacterium]
MNSQKLQDESNIVNFKADNVQGRFRLGKRKLVALLSIVLIVLIVIGVFLWSKNESNIAANNKKNADKLAYESTLKQAKSYESALNLAGESKVLQDYLKTNPPKQYQYTPLMDLASIAYNQRKDALAISYYKKAETASGKIQEYDVVGIAVAAQAEGDKKTAISYYKKAIKLTQVQPGVANSIDDYKSAIDYLEGKP